MTVFLASIAESFSEELNLSSHMNFHFNERLWQRKLKVKPPLKLVARAVHLRQASSKHYLVT